MNNQKELLVLTGISGAGKSTALNAVEDMGYYCMDNIPPQLLSTFVELYFETGKRASKIAVVLDIRAREFLNGIFNELTRVEKLGMNYKLIFLDASDETIIKRYKEFRRPHPLAPDGNILEGLREEREKLEDIKDKSDYIVDTTRLNTHQLKAEIIGILEKESSSKIQISIVSFGFKNGILLDADFIFDARFLDNPYYVEDLKQKTGQDKEVLDYVFNQEYALGYIDKIEDMIKYIVPKYIKEKKLQLTIGIGCTGGKHRSVTLANELYKRLESEKDYGLKIEHRDIGKDALRGK